MLAATARRFAEVVSMHNERQSKIRERAYQIWEREGRQDGRAEEHWSQAEQELAAGEDAAPPAINGGAALESAPKKKNGAVKAAAASKSSGQRKRRGAQAPSPA
jgi:hypothetical protein